MKRYFYSSLILLLASFCFSFSGCKESSTEPQNHLPKIESLTANPTTVLISTETTLTCIATDEDGDNLTVLWSSKRGAFPNGIVGVTVKWISPSTAGKDTIDVTIFDGKQSIQGKLEIIVGTISASPTLLTPNNNAIEVALSPTLSWNAVSNAVSYTLQISTNNSFSSFVYNQNGLTNTSQQISGLNHTSTYYWRVNSSNVYGTSSWSSVFSFKTLAPPDAPTLLTPTNNTTEVALSPTLTWNAVSNATSYTLQVSTSNSFNSFVYNQSGLTNTNQQLSGLNSNTTYYWRVNSSNIYGTSSWSTTFSFKTLAPPQAPTLLSPTNDAIEVVLSSTLTWNTVSNAVSYTLQVSTSNSFNTFVYNQSGLTNTSQQISGLTNFTQYYWHVNATNSYGTSSWSTYWTYTTISGPCPSVPTITYEGKTYNTVQIGSQCWLRENLDVGTMIQGDQNANNNSIIEKYCYDDNPNNCTTYGALYQWNEVMQYVTTEQSQGICPSGWHIPTKAEFETLGIVVSNNSESLKEVGQGAATNISGLTVLLGGYRYHSGGFYNLRINAGVWSSTEVDAMYAYRLGMDINGGNYALDSNVLKVEGNAVRCIKD